MKRRTVILMLVGMLMPLTVLAGAAPDVYVTKIGTTFIFSATLLTDVNGLLTGGTTTLRLYELQADGTLKSYDFSSNTFKTTVLTTATANMTHRQGIGTSGAVDTGMWTALLTNITGFTVNNVYLMVVNNTNSSPQTLAQMFQYGSTTSPSGKFFLVSGRVQITGNAYAGAQ